MSKSILTLALSVFLAGSAATALAAGPLATHAVSTEQLERVSVGVTRADVVRLLGEPDYVPRWMSGSYSMAYRLADEPSSQAYIDVDEQTGKVVGWGISAAD